MARVLDSLEHLIKAPDSTAILGRIGILALHAAGILDPGFRLKPFLQGDLVIPGVTHVVLVQEWSQLPATPE